MTDPWNPNSRIGRLVLTHFVAAVACAANMNPNRTSLGAWIVNSGFTALVGSELCLLGLGTAAVVERSAKGWRRLGLVAAATLWVWLLSLVALCRTKPVPPAFILLLAPMVSLAAISFGIALRYRGVRLVRLPVAATRLDDPFQFTLGRLLLLTGAVALFLGAARAIRDSSLSESRLEGLYALVVLSMVCSLTAIAALAALWAVLGAGRPRGRLPLAIGLAAAVGLLPAYSFHTPRTAYIILAAVASLLSIFTAASLCVLRQAGYRLTRRDQGVGNRE